MNDLLITACFHEAGHTVTAYNLGYSCDKISVDDAGNGLAIINYAEDEEVAISILYDKPLDEFNHMNRDEAREIAKKVCKILISGLVSEYILAHSSSPQTQITVKQTGTDFLKVKYIAEKYGLSVRDEINEVYSVLQSKESWQLVRILVYYMICITPIRLNSYEISSVFENFKQIED